MAYEKTHCKRLCWILNLQNQKVVQKLYNRSNAIKPRHTYYQGILSLYNIHHSLKHKPGVISGAACVNTTNQTDLCKGVWWLWPNPWPFSEYMCVYVHANTVYQRAFTSPKGPKMKGAWSETRGCKKGWKSLSRAKQELSFMSGEWKTREQECERKVKGRTFDTSTAFHCKINCDINNTWCLLELIPNCIFLSWIIPTAFVEWLTGQKHLYETFCTRSPFKSLIIRSTAATIRYFHYQKKRNAQHNFPKPKGTSSTEFFCPTNIPKSNNSSSTIKNEKGNE